jgi:hypothetical protein
MSNETLDVLANLVRDLLECHEDEMQHFHMGDSAEPGPDPMGCSYCADIDRAQQILAAEGRA